jgi:hypothetical protein
MNALLMTSAAIVQEGRMKFKTVMTIKAIVCLGFGPLLLFFPAWLLELLGAEYCTGAACAAMVGILLMTWLARNVDAGVARRAICWNLFVYDAIGLVLTLVFLLSGRLNPLGWGIVAVYLFFTVGFGWLLLPKTASDQ